jgi:uncharacterized protein YbjT (DUF2867 family)
VPDPSAPIALVAGGTGLVGRSCLARLVDDPRCGGVVAVARRPIEERERLRVVVTDFASLESRAPPAAATAVCALGTTIRQAGSQAAFRAVDHDAVAAFARWARRAGCRTFVLCSSVGADSRSRTFYLRVKGEVEDTVAAVGFERLVVVRPGFILGGRAERRPAEAIAQAVMPVIGAALVGPLRRYRAIAAETVAAAMAGAALDPEPGRFVWEYDEMTARAGA